MTPLEILQKARDVFIERGGAKHCLLDVNNKVCAAGAIYALVPNFEEHYYRNNASLYVLAVKHFGQNTLSTIYGILSYYSDQEYGIASIESVNDNYGMDAVMNIFNIAIKELESGKVFDDFKAPEWWELF